VEVGKFASAAHGRLVHSRNVGHAQVDTPFDIYEHPANLFVASFIGSPPMNLAQAAIEQAKEGLAVKLGDAEISIPPELVTRNGLDACAGKTVIVGIRPEDISGVGRKSSGL